MLTTAGNKVQVQMPNIYRALMTAATSKTAPDKNTIITAISDAVRSCQTRTEAMKFRI